MRALQLQSRDGPAALRVVDLPEPTATADQVLIDVHAAGVGFPDLLMSQGRYQVTPDLPAVLGDDLAGTVRSAPAGASVAAGDRVWATGLLGSHAAVVAAAPEQVHPLPDRLGFPHGAALGSNYLTALFALERRGRLAGGETLLVLGAAGGLGTAIVAVATALGARVLAVVSDDAKAKTAREAGAAEVVVGEDFRARVLELTDGRGADMVADIVGGPANLEGIRATAAEGRLLILGFASGEIPQIAANRLLLRNIAVVGAGLGAFLAVAPDLYATTARRLGALLDSGLTPLVGDVVPIDDGPRAFELLAGRAARGKVVLSFED